jgi:hypothetical protein
MLKSKLLDLIAGKGKEMFATDESLAAIEKRLLEIEEEKPRRIHNLSESYSNSNEDIIEGMDIQWLDTEKAILQLKRRFILDRRESWKSKAVWNVFVPILVATITALIVGNMGSPN